MVNLDSWNRPRITPSIEKRNKKNSSSIPAHKSYKFQYMQVQIDECCKFCVTYKYTLEFKLILFGLVKFSCYCNTVDGWISMWVDSIWAIFLRPIQLLWGHNVHSILGLLSTQLPIKKWSKLSTQDWVLNKSKFWVEIECSILCIFSILSLSTQ